MKLRWIAPGVVLVLAAVAWYGYRLLMSSMFRFGDVATRGPFLAATSESEEFWGVTAYLPGAQGTNSSTSAARLKIRYFSVGSGPIQILTVHGGPGGAFKEAWPALRHLDLAKYTIHFYDQRGCGRSDRFPSFAESPAANDSMFKKIGRLNDEYGLAVHLKDLEEIRLAINKAQGLPADEPIILIGHSFGAFLSAMYAAEFPRHVKRLVLACPADVLTFPRSTIYSAKHGRQVTRDLFEMIGERLDPSRGPTWKKVVAEYIDLGLQMTDEERIKANGVIGPWYVEALQEDLKRARAAGDDRLAQVHARTIDFMMTLSEKEKDQVHRGPGFMVQGLFVSMGLYHEFGSGISQSIQNYAKTFATATGSVDSVQRLMKVLVLHAQDDLQVEEVAVEYRDLFAPHVAADLQVVADSGHFLFHEQPESTAKILSTFLQN